MKVTRFGRYTNDKVFYNDFTGEVVDIKELREEIEQMFEDKISFVKIIKKLNLTFKLNGELLSPSQKLKIIWKNTHKDYRGLINGEQYVMKNSTNGTCLAPLNGFTEEEIENDIKRYVVYGEVK